MNNPDFKNSTDRAFWPINCLWREYLWLNAGAIAETYRINRPIMVHVSKSGHYVFDAAGVMHFIPNDFHVVRWLRGPGGDDISVPQGLFKDR